MKTIKGIFLDDERNPKDVTWISYGDVDWLIVRDFYEFRKAVIKYLWTQEELIITFDHDLQCFSKDLETNKTKEHTGYDCLKLLVDICQHSRSPLPNCYFHTQNPIGKENMQKYYFNAMRYQDGLV